MAGELPSKHRPSDQIHESGSEALMQPAENTEPETERPNVESARDVHFMHLWSTLEQDSMLLLIWRSVSVMRSLLHICPRAKC